LNESRGSKSLEWVGKRIGKKYNSVSEYEKGYVKPPPLVVALLIIIFKGDPHKVSDYLSYDPIEIIDLCDFINALGQSAADFKNNCWSKIITARKFREIEGPNNASNMIDACSISLEARIKAEIDSLKDIQEYKFMLLIAYGEQIGCMTLLLPRELVINAVVPIYSKMTKLANEIENVLTKPNLLSMQTDLFNSVGSNSQIFSGLAFSDCWLAAAYFVGKSYDKAIDYQIKAIPLCGFDKNLLAETYRGLLLSLAHNHKRVRETKKTIRKISTLLGNEIDDPVDIDSLLCAIAEAKMLIGENGAREVLAEVGRSIYKNNKFLPLKRIQYYKTKLFISINDLKENRKIDRKLMLQFTKEGFSLAQLYGLDRHKSEIIRLGRRIVDIEETSLWLGSELADSERLVIVKDFF
jgi:hypothetical protein